uniref:Chromosome 1 open reading frame 216 n=1 Tax=Erpetoichthys calabaricus TaxID=27687 RepID=A0A8C4SLI1_ERPCA
NGSLVLVLPVSQLCCYHFTPSLSLPDRKCLQDSNFNFLESRDTLSTFDSNDNLNQNGPGTGTNFYSTLTQGAEEHCQEYIREPPEGSEGRNPRADIDSPVLEGAAAPSVGNTWGAAPGKDSPVPAWDKAPEGLTEVNNTKPPSQVPDLSSVQAHRVLPALLEAVCTLQEQERFKAQEKERHQVQLTMYRRLALIRWIRSLQQKVAEQQGRLQESYDIILENRKVLLRCRGHRGVVGST